jgi:ATP-dependent protease ClpP protease subunit
MATKISRRGSTSKSELIYDIHEFGINIDTSEVFLHSYIGVVEEEPGVDYRMAVRLEKNLRILAGLNKERVLIHMHTFGGCWQDGMGMYDAIQACHDMEITILAYGHARSMSSIILQAADYRVLTPYCEFMIHDGTMDLDDNSTCKIAATEIRWMEKETEEMMEIYVNKCQHGRMFQGQSKEQITKVLREQMDKKENWYLTAREAIDYGFADAILGDEGYDNIQALLKVDGV